MKLRDYQEQAVEAMYDYFRSEQGNPLIAMPTGTGKSVVIGEFVRRTLTQWPRQRVMMVTHVKELIDQNFQKLLTLWPTAPAGIYSAGLKRRDTSTPIIYAGIGSVGKVANQLGHIDLLLVDEAHLISPKEATMYRKLMTQLMHVNPHLKVIGFTATPYRLGLGHLTEGGLFTHTAFDLTSMDAFNKLVADGYLAPLRSKRTGTELDVSGVGMVGGEYNANQLQNAVDKEVITRQALTEALALGADRHHWLVFASGVEHAEHITEMLGDMGIPAVCIHGGLAGEDRDKGIAAFKAGKYRVAVNNNVLTTGFDFPAIDLIVMLRPTTSPGLWVQMLGRGTRPAEGKTDCLVLDFAGNTNRLGPINDPVLPSPKGKKGVGTAPVKVCPHCDTYNHASARICVHCGEEFELKVKFEATASTTEVMRTVEPPKTEIFAITKIVASIHRKEGKPPSLCMTYYCGYNLFKEWICFEHEGFAKMKANRWWRQRTHWPFPPSTEDALQVVDLLRIPTHLRVWVNTKFPEILAYDFTGTGTEFEPFGAPAPSGSEGDAPPSDVAEGRLQSGNHTGVL